MKTRTFIPMLCIIFIGKSFASLTNTQRPFLKKIRVRNMSLSSSEANSYIIPNFQDINNRIINAASSANIDPQSIRLVAVSKTKPVEDILQLYKFGHRVFGENYVQELVEKASILPNDIQWHFIGHLQSSKAKNLIRDVPNLAFLETIDSEKLATKLQNALAASGSPRNLQVFIQVDTSNEDTKFGIPPSEVPAVMNHIRLNCPLLLVKGLMTIGAPGDTSCLQRLVTCRSEVSELLNISSDSLELSMGMSDDFEEAIKLGSTSVRVGSLIFGARDYSKK